MTEKINFFLNSRQRTSLFSVCLSDYFPHPAPKNRRFQCPVHISNPALRSLLYLNSRIPAFKRARSRIPKNLLETLLIRWNLNTSKTKEQKRRSAWLVRDVYLNAVIWLVRDTYPKRSDWCEQHTTLYANIYIYFFFLKITFFTCAWYHQSAAARHSPFTPLVQVDETRVVCWNFFGGWLLKHWKTRIAHRKWRWNFPGRERIAKIRKEKPKVT